MNKNTSIVTLDTDAFMRLVGYYYKNDHGFHQQLETRFSHLWFARITAPVWTSILARAQSTTPIYSPDEVLVEFDRRKARKAAKKN